MAFITAIFVEQALAAASIPRDRRLPYAEPGYGNKNGEPRSEPRYLRYLHLIVLSAAA
jgi:hypothetical protein